MAPLFRLADAAREDAAVAAWFEAPDNPLRVLAWAWFEKIMSCGPDVLQLLHDGYPTACLGDAAFAYVGAFKAHVNVGFFHGADLPDPDGLLEGSGKRMRHVKLRWGHAEDEAALAGLIATAYEDIQARLAA